MKASQARLKSQANKATIARINVALVTCAAVNATRKLLDKHIQSAVDHGQDAVEVCVLGGLLMPSLEGYDAEVSLDDGVRWLVDGLRADGFEAAYNIGNATFSIGWGN